MSEYKAGQNDAGGPSTCSGQDLRRQAEERLKKPSSDLDAIRSEETGLLLHELQVHQIELEMQNEELRRAQEDLESSRARYFDLYDLAPVGYLTLNEKGLILEANLTAAQMLGVERSRMAGQPVSYFIHRDDQDIYYLNLKQLLEKQTPQTFELRMVGNGSRPFWVQMKTRAALDGDGAPVCRITLSDISERMKAEEALRLANDGLERRVLERTVDLEKEIVERKGIEDLLRESEKHLRYLSAKILTTQETERKRIAGELHDGIAASLSALKFGIEQMVQIAPNENNQAKVENLVIRVKLIIEETRRIMADLRPSVLDDLGIVPAIRWFCREFQKTYSGVVIGQQIDLEENEIPESLRTPIFRIVQEAMNNIAKHSLAFSVDLSLKKSTQGIELIIRDNGQGFDLERKTDDSRTGLGLVSMRERAELTGGSFAITTGQETGTTIRVLWPLASPA